MPPKPDPEFPSDEWFEDRRYPDIEVRGTCDGTVVDDDAVVLFARQVAAAALRWAASKHEWIETQHAMVIGGIGPDALRTEADRIERDPEKESLLREIFPKGGE